MHSDGSLEAEGLCAVEDTEGDVLTYAFTQGRTAREGKFARKGGTGNSLIHAKPVGINP